MRKIGVLFIVLVSLAALAVVVLQPRTSASMTSRLSGPQPIGAVGTPVGVADSS